MRALVVYESMYGNTHAIAEHLAEGLRPTFDVTIVNVTAADLEAVDAYDLVVCGGPTHAHSLSRESTRNAAATAAAKPDSGLQLEPEALDTGLRDWLKALHSGRATMAAAYDTRADAPAVLTGRAAKGIARRLRDDGFQVIVEPESFLVDKQNRLVAGEAERATAWGAAVATAATAAAAANVAR